MLQWGESWGLVQDAWWWNFTAPPEAHAIQGKLMRPSLKPCVWLGPFDCYRNQNSVLWDESQSNVALRTSARCGRKQQPSGHGFNPKTVAAAAARRGGVTPFNVLPVSNTNSNNSAGSHGHGAGTPIELARWWVRYISPPGGTVLDPFSGTGTVQLAALAEGRNAVGCERMEKYAQIAARRIAEAMGKPVTPTPPQPPRHWLDFGDLDTGHYADQFRVSKI